MICPKHLIPVFTIFNANDDYLCMVNRGKGVAIFTKANKPSLKVYRLVQMNEAAQKRFKLFLELWLKHGKDFVLRLKAQAIMLKVA